MRTTPPRIPSAAGILGAVAIFGALAWALLAGGTFLGTPVAQAAGGWLASDATVAAPASAAFAIWGLIYLGLAVYGVWQVIAPPPSDRLHARIRGWAVASVLLNGLWLQMVQWGQLGLSVVVMLVLLAVLFRIVRQISAEVLDSPTDRWVTRATFGVYLGWVLVAAIANLSAWVASLNFDTWSGTITGVMGFLVLFTGLGVCAMTFKNPMGLYVNAGSLWGIAWIAVARLAGPLQSTFVAICATVGALLMLVCLISSARRRVARLLRRSKPTSP